MPTIAFDARDAFAPHLRGWGRHVALLLGALRGRGAESGLDYRVIERGGPGPELLFEQVGLPALLRRERPALIHAPNCFLPLRRPCPGVVTVHDLAFEEYPEDFSGRTGWKYRYFTPRAASGAEAVICVSEFTRRDVCERYGVDRARVHVVPNAPALAIGDLPPPAGPYLLAVGDLRPKKNFARLIEAVARLRAGGGEHRLVIAGGDGGIGDELRRRAAGEPVEFTGYVGDAELDALMRGAAALVHPSLYEGFGLVIVEAMARGVPVACADATALPETAGGAAELFDPHDPESIAAGVERALTRARVERGLARAAELSWERSARETEAVYREVLGA